MTRAANPYDNLATHTRTHSCFRCTFCEAPCPQRHKQQISPNALLGWRRTTHRDLTGRSSRGRGNSAQGRGSQDREVSRIWWGMREALLQAHRATDTHDTDRMACLACTWAGKVAQALDPYKTLANGTPRLRPLDCDSLCTTPGRQDLCCDLVPPLGP